MRKVTGFFKKIQYNSPVVLTFAILSFVVLILSTIAGYGVTNSLFSVYRGSPADPLFYLRILGHVLGHASFEHFSANIIMLLIAGPMLEEKYGSKRLLVMILFTAAVTGIIHIAFSERALLGASGIVFMLILLSSYTNLQSGRIPLTLILCVAVFIGREIANGISNAYPDTSQIGHILGGLCGAAFGFFFNKEKLIKPSTRTIPAEPVSAEPVDKPL